MPKKTINTTLPKNVNAKTLSEQVLFKPTMLQAKMKARFWSRFQPGPMMGSITDVSEKTASEITKCSYITRWWHVPGFVEWFCNKEEERERIKYLFNKGLDTIEEILDNPNENANAKANLIKMLAEMNGYLNKKPVERFADEAINKMTINQLNAFLENKGFSVLEGKVINVESEEEKAGDKGPDNSEPTK